MIQADADEVSQRPLRPGAPKKMQMAVFTIPPMRVVVAVGAANRVHQVARGVVPVLNG